MEYSFINLRRVALIPVILLVVGFGAWALFGRHQQPKQYGHSATPQAVVQVTASGFTPSTLMIKAGTTVSWKNTDTAAHSIASNPYPADNSLPSLSSNPIAPHGSYTFTPTAVGTIHYHDNLDPSHNGTITVVQ